MPDVDDRAVLLVTVALLTALHERHAAQYANDQAGAKALLRVGEMPEAERRLHSKDIVSGRQIVLYGNGSEGVAPVKARLTKLGREGVTLVTTGAGVGGAV